MNYYNTHGYFYTFKEFIELEVEDRENYTYEEIEQWITKYNIKLNQKCIWVCKNKDDLKMYSYDIDDIIEIDSSIGFIIPESDDGDNGFLFALKEY